MFSTNEYMRIVVDKNLPKPTIWGKKSMTEILKNYGHIYNTSFSLSGELVDFADHSVLMGYLTAFKDHCPMKITPTILWQVILLGFHTQVIEHSEDMRHFFVNFKGKENIIIERDDLHVETANKNNWEEVIEDFTSQINKKVTKGVIDDLTPNFSTDTKTSLTVGKISLMATMKNYFNYIALFGGCGIPYIDLEGSLNDWENLLKKIELLSKYNLNWWVDKMRPVIKKIIETKKGKIDLQFWKSFVLERKENYNIYGSGGELVRVGVHKYIDGWIVKFFPFNSLGIKYSLDSIKEGDTLPSEILSCPLTVLDRETLKQYELDINAGFLGIKQDNLTGCVEPAIGWFITDRVEKKIKRIKE